MENLSANQRVPSVIAVTSGKGGVGKTSVSVNLAIALAKKGRSVVLFDADMGLANVDIALGLSPNFDISDVLSGRKTLRDILLDGPHGIKVIPASSGISSMANLSETEQISLMRQFEELDEGLDHLIVDTSAGIDTAVLNFAAACHDVLVVVCDEPTSLADSYALIKILATEKNVENVQILVNRVQGDLQGRRVFSHLDRVARQFLTVELEYMGFVPFDFYMQKSLLKRSSVVERYPRSISALALKELADRVDKKRSQLNREGD